MVALLYKWLITFTFFLTPPSPEIHSGKAFRHPFYVSVTEVNHNMADKNIEISCRIFTDDLETTLTKVYQAKVDLFKPVNKASIDKLIADYIKKHLIIKLDGKPAQLEYVGHEREEESVWSYFQVPNSAAPTKIEISNNILYDAFDQQINIMHVSVGGNRKSLRLNFPDTAAKFEF